QTGQRHHLLGRGRQVVGTQTQFGVAWRAAVPTGRTVIIVAAEVERAEETVGLTVAEPLATAVVLTRRTGPARPLLPPLFRSSKAVWRAVAPRRCTASRTSNSVLPRSSRSGLPAKRRARRRPSSSKGGWS